MWVLDPSNYTDYALLNVRSYIIYVVATRFRFSQSTISFLDPHFHHEKQQPQVNFCAWTYLKRFVSNLIQKEGLHGKASQNRKGV